MSTVFEEHIDLVFGTVATAPSPATSGVTITLGTGEGALFPTGQCTVLAWPGPTAAARPTRANAELLQVVSVVGDVITTNGRDYGSFAGGAKSIAIGWEVMLVPAAHNWNDVESAIFNLEEWVEDFPSWIIFDNTTGDEKVTFEGKVHIELVDASDTPFTIKQGITNMMVVDPFGGVSHAYWDASAYYRWISDTTTVLLTLQETGGFALSNIPTGFFGATPVAQQDATTIQGIYDGLVALGLFAAETIVPPALPTWWTIVDTAGDEKVTFGGMVVIFPTDTGDIPLIVGDPGGTPWFTISGLGEILFRYSDPASRFLWQDDTGASILTMNAIDGVQISSASIPVGFFGETPVLQQDATTVQEIMDGLVAIGLFNADTIVLPPTFTTPTWWVIDDTPGSEKLTFEQGILVIHAQNTRTALLITTDSVEADGYEVFRIDNPDGLLVRMDSSGNALFAMGDDATGFDIEGDAGRVRFNNTGVGFFGETPSAQIAMPSSAQEVYDGLVAFGLFAGGGTIAAGAPLTWIDVATTVGFSAGWTNYGSPYSDVAYAVQDNMIYFRGTCTGGGSGTVIFVLPGGSQPAFAGIMRCFSSTSVGNLEVLTNGNVDLFGAGGATNCSLDGVSISLV